MTSINKYLALYASFFFSALAQLVFNPVNNFRPISGEAPSLPLNIDTLFNNRGFGKVPGDADFDGSGGTIDFLTHSEGNLLTDLF